MLPPVGPNDPSGGRHYVEQFPSYYPDANEPRGRWVGIAARELVLSGELDDEDFLAVMDGLDPNRPDRHLGRVYGDDSVRGFDVTCSAPKSVSVLFALGDDEVRYRVLRSHDAADVTSGNEELRRQLRQLRRGRQRPSFGPEIEL